MILLLILYITSGSFLGKDFHSLMAGGIALIFLGGIIFFMENLVSEMHKPSKASFYLTLPATNFEKFISLLFTCSLLFTFVIIIMYFLVLWIGFALKSNIPQGFYNLTNYFYTIHGYILMQIIFFTGMVYFRKNQFLKTASLVVIILISIVLIIKYFSSSINLLDDSFFFHYMFPDALRWRLYDITMSYIFPLLLLISSYYRIKEKEV
jgi:hypothetical protein